MVPLWITWLPLLANRYFGKALQRIDEAVQRIIRERRRSGQEGGDDLLSMLMEALDEKTGETMSDRQIRDEVTTIYLAWHEMMVVTLAWTWYLPSENPKVVRRVCQEVSRVIRERTPRIDDGIERDLATLPDGVDDLAHRGR